MFYGAQCGLAIFTATGIAVVLAGLRPWIPIAILLSQLPGMPMEWRLRDATAAALCTHSPQARRLQYFRGQATDPAVAKDLRLAGAFDFLRQRYLAIWATTVGEIAGLRRRLAIRMVLARLLSSGVLVAVYVDLVCSAVDGRTTIGRLVYFGGAIVLLTQSLHLIGFTTAYLPQVFGYLPSLQRILDAGPDLLPVAAKPVTLDARATARIAYEDVYSPTGCPGPGVERSDVPTRPGREPRLDRAQRSGQDDNHQAAAPLVRPRRRSGGSRPARRRRRGPDHVVLR